MKQRNIQTTLFNSGVGWSSHLISIIWSHIYSVWINRNLARHGKDQAEQKLKQQQQCIDEIACYYEYKSSNQLLLSDDMTTMFYSTLQHHLRAESELHQLQTWLCTYREVIEASRLEQQAAQVLVRKSCPAISPSIPMHVIIPQSQVDQALTIQSFSSPQQHIKNDTIQFDMLHCTQVSDATSHHTPAPSAHSVCSHSTSTFSHSFVSPRAVTHKQHCWKCPTDDLNNK